jgi:hypothetical protein
MIVRVTFYDEDYNEMMSDQWNIPEETKNGETTPFSVREGWKYFVVKFNP